MTFAPAIRQARIRAGLRQYELAEVLGVTKRVISLWETGKSQPSLKNWHKLESALSTEFRVSVSERSPAEQSAHALNRLSQ